MNGRGWVKNRKPLARRARLQQKAALKRKAPLKAKQKTARKGKNPYWSIFTQDMGNGRRGGAPHIRGGGQGSVGKIRFYAPASQRLAHGEQLLHT